MAEVPQFSTPRVFSWLLAILLPVFAVYPALVNAIEEHAYDAAEFHIFRGVVWSAARAEGSLYPRWVQSINGGLGGPLFEFYSPLVYFLMDLLNQMGIPHTIGWRWLTGLAFVAASTGMFGFALSLFKRADLGLLCAAIFTYNAYLLRDLFERGSPQGWTVALLPWLLWLLLRAAENFSPVRIALAGVCFAAMMLLHNATALLLMPVVLIFILFLTVEGRSHPPSATDGRARPVAFYLGPILGLGVGLLLAAFYLIPYISEIQLVQFDNPLSAAYALPAANALRLEDILTLGRAMDTGLGNNAIGEGGGLLHALALLLAIPVGWNLYRARRWAELVWVMGYLSLVSVLIWLQTESANFVWNAFPALNVFQFRWRLLAPLGFVSSLMLGHFFIQWQSRLKSAVICLLIAVYCLMAFPSLYPSLFFRYIQFAARPTLADAQAFALKNNAPGLTSFNEYLPRWRQTPLTRYATEPISNLPSDARISNVSHPNGYLRAEIESPSVFTAVLNILYYPGWVAYLDGLAKTIAPTARDGLIAIEVPPGRHTLELRYEGTFAQHIGDWVSLAAIAGLIAFVLAPRKHLGKFPLNPSLSGAAAIAYLAPRWWIPIAIIALAAFKVSWVDPQTTWFRATSRCDRIQDAVVQTNVTFENRIRVCGYALSRQEFQINDQLLITIYWEIQSPATENDSSFVHLLGGKFNPDTGNPLWGQQDKQTPAEHALTDWVPGIMYRDVYAFRVAPNAPGGEYQLEIGWQDADGKRLKPNIIAKNSALSVSDLDALLISSVKIQP